MAVDSSHSHPLYTRVGNTEIIVAHLVLPVVSMGPIDAGEPVNDGDPKVVDIDLAAVGQLRRLLGLTPPFKPVAGNDKGVAGK